MGASLYVPFTLAPGETRNIRLYMAWHVPYSQERIGGIPRTDTDIPDAPVCPDELSNCYTYENNFEGNYRLGIAVGLAVYKMLQTTGWIIMMH